ncbi:DUF438 domain-containing protein [Maribellus sediminis]|uniref:DUF438 domain-containing protein n=1 Tax=Maribellus sediminis TaxID=2696285 RepID=UPI0014304CF0|nr:DUF438 domain-containing protein [Maribellus sediminis]
MSEFIDNSKYRKARLKESILRLHAGDSTDDVRQELLENLSNIPYGEVVEVEQELIAEGLPEEEVLQLCDAHSAVLHGAVDLSASKSIPEGHPVDVMLQENKMLKRLSDNTTEELLAIKYRKGEDFKQAVLKIRGAFNQLMDVDKHYQRKEYLLFPYLEKAGITGPPKVMWGKHDEIREQLKGSIEILQLDEIESEDLTASAKIILLPALKGVYEMTIKEEEILFPMMMDTLSDADWYEIQKQSLEIGYCLYDPQVEWKPEGVEPESINAAQKEGKNIQLPSGSFTAEELLSILNTIPVDMTFVDRNDKVKYFTQSKDRIFQRNRAILNRDVRHCHPPASAHIVDKILEDFKSGKQNRAPFWINMGGRFIHIEYFALHNDAGEYLGTLEVSRDLTHDRSLEGEQRILSYK